MADKESQPCSQCQCPIVWGFELKTPETTNRFKSGKKLGWWKEDLTKQLHSLENCKKFKESGEFLKTENTHGMIKKELLVDKEYKSHPEVKKLKVNELDAADIGGSKIRAEVKVNLKILKILEEETIAFLPIDSRGDKIGMWMKLLLEMNGKIEVKKN